MNAAHFHLAVNHLPVVGLLFALGVLAVGRFIRSEAALKTGLWLTTITGLLAIPAYVSGEPAEEIVERLPGISDALIEPHEEAAVIALTVTLLAGVLAGIALFLSRGARPSPKRFLLAVFGSAIIAVGCMAWTAKLGGEIHHPEIRETTSS
jgi:hypothetical protein